ncbi:MAG: hypothetical protein RTU92_01885 [Candidatus Thorarchaeota archaeon]
MSGMLQNIGSLDVGVTNIGTKLDWSKMTVGQKAARVAARALLLTSLALAMSMYIMRMPVMDASAA